MSRSNFDFPFVSPYYAQQPTPEIFEPIEQPKTIDPILTYDKYIVAFSGGKDSTACFLHLLEIGVPVEKIELWHHDIDGRGPVFMDWESTPAYCQAFADTFNVPLYFSWKQGGFKTEMTRENSLTAPIFFETPEGIKQVGGTQGKKSTRLKYPQVSPDLKVRWCSAYLKIDVCATAIRNQDRFNGIHTLVLSGERGEESKARSKYAILEPDRADGREGKKKRHVDRWRPIRDWSEREVWAIIERFKVRAHPAYYLGWGRVSCKFCIFGNANQFASAFAISPKQGNEIAEYEQLFGLTIKRNMSLTELVAKGTPYEMSAAMIDCATSDTYTESIFVEDWQLPAGAFGESCGPV